MLGLLISSMLLSRFCLRNKIEYTLVTNRLGKPRLLRDKCVIFITWNSELQMQEIELLWKIFKYKYRTHHVMILFQTRKQNLRLDVTQITLRFNIKSENSWTCRKYVKSKNLNCKYKAISYTINVETIFCS